MITRRQMNIGAGALVGSAALPFGGANAVEINEDGLHVQDWFLESFLEVADDQMSMNEQGKHLAVLFEQKGCPYCREMHEVNFAKPQIREFVESNFGILQINIWGSKEVTDLESKQMPEKEFARSWRVNFTPTIVFLRKGDLANVPLALAEAARMPGYLKPFHFMSMFEFVAGNHYEDQIFQRFLQDKFDRYKAEGKKPDIW